MFNKMVNTQNSDLLEDIVGQTDANIHLKISEYEN